MVANSSTVKEPINQKMLNRREAAEFLGLKKQTLALWACRGTGPAFYRLGGRACRYRMADLLAFQEQERVGTKAQK